MLDYCTYFVYYMWSNHPVSFFMKCVSCAFFRLRAKILSDCSLQEWGRMFRIWLLRWVQLKALVGETLVHSNMEMTCLPGSWLTGRETRCDSGRACLTRKIWVNFVPNLAKFLYNYHVNMGISLLFSSHFAKRLVVREELTWVDFSIISFLSAAHPLGLLRWDTCAQ